MLACINVNDAASIGQCKKTCTFCTIECLTYLRANYKTLFFLCLVESFIKYLIILFQKTLEPLIPIIQVIQPGSCSLSVRIRGWFIKPPHREKVLVVGIFQYVKWNRACPWPAKIAWTCWKARKDYTFRIIELLWHFLKL